MHKDWQLSDVLTSEEIHESKLLVATLLIIWDQPLMYFITYSTKPIFSDLDTWIVLCFLTPVEPWEVVK